MHLHRAIRLAAAVCAGILASCGGGGGGASAGAGSTPVDTADDTVLATVTPAAAVSAVIASGTQSPSVQFATSDGQTAHNLVITGGLSSLPYGWTTASASFGCSAVSTGTGCELSGLAFKPYAATGGTLTLTYSYTSRLGNAKAGSVAIPYGATTHNAVTAAVSSAANSLTVSVGAATQTVTITFATSDGNPASNLAVNGLGSLPQGWAGAGAFDCTQVSTSGCALALSFTPALAGVGGGTLSLGYTYDDNAGTAHSGTVTIPYQVTADNNVDAALSMVGTVVAVENQDTKTVTVTWNTDDSNSASTLAVSGLGSLPSGWTSSPASLSCSTVASSANGCQLTLSFTPTVLGSGAVSLGYSYLSNTGATKNGTVTIPYRSIGGNVYVADFDGDQVVRCGVSTTNGTLSGCTVAVASIDQPTSIAFSAGSAYVAAYGADTVYQCTVSSVDGSLDGCAATGGGYVFSHPQQVTVSGSNAYIADSGHGAIVLCQIDGTTGALGSCTTTGAYTLPAGSTGTPSPVAFALSGATAYIGDHFVTSPYACAVAGDGTLTSCTASTTTIQGATVPHIESAAVGASALYLGVSFAVGAFTCPIDNSGSVSGCTNNAPSAIQSSFGIALNNGFAYVGDEQSHTLWVCSIVGSNFLSCTASAGTGLVGPKGIALR